MINYLEIVKRMQKHFPRWMDIRRKVNSSTGGAIVTSIAEEVTNINEAIIDYKKDFFISNYLDKDNEILDFMYFSTIGETDISNIKILTGEYNITNSQIEFYGNDGYAYYDDGKIYFKEDLKEVTIKIYDYETVFTLEKMHVWNIYDEFAIFLGLRRYENETNKELLNRIISHGKEKINSTEDGLKNAIISDLINIVPELSKDDIKIERQTPENLNKYYDKFETILDHLSGVNRDTFKEKQWDVDLWEIKGNKIDYIPHAWDVALSSYANGVGFESDLETVLTDSSSEAEIEMSFYKKKLEIVNAYIQNTNAKETVKFRLKKYNDDLIAKKVAYKITASESEDVNPDLIVAETIEKRASLFDVKIDDVADNYKFGIQKEDMRVLDSNYNYLISLEPIDSLKEFAIQNLSVINDGKKTDLINYMQPGFEPINGGIRNAKTRAYIEDRYHFNSLENITKTIDGFVLEDSAISGVAKLNLAKYRNQRLYIDYYCQKSDVMPRDIKMKNCFIQGNAIIADTTHDEKKVSINIKACELSFITNGQVTIQYRIGAENIVVETKNGKNIPFEIPKQSKATDVDITITFEGEGASNNIKEIKYNAFDIQLDVDKGVLLNHEGSYTTPNVDSTLSIEMRTYTAFSPIIKWIYIGNKLGENDGIRDILVTCSGENSMLIADATNCRYTLKKIEKESSELVSTIYDYKPYVFYSSTDNAGRLELMLDDYTDIRSIEVEDGNIETIVMSPTEMQYVLKIDSGAKISHIKIGGKKDSIIGRVNIGEVLDKKGMSSSVYDFKCARNNNYIIAKHKTTNEIRDVHIYKDDISEFSSSSVIRMNIPEEMNITSKFMTLGDSSSTIGIVSTGAFDYVTFIPESGEEYVAINERNIVFDITTGIEILDTFNKGYELCKKEMFYTLTPLTEGYDIRFEKAGAFDVWSDKNLGKCNIGIRRKETNRDTFNYSIINVEETLQLGSTIEIPDTIFFSGEKIDMRKYIIDNDMDITYLDKVSDFENADSYIFSEKVYVDELMFSKLKYSNIREIDVISHEYDGSYTLINGQDFELLNKEGIIIWKNRTLIKRGYVLITYNIKVASAINMSMDYIYSKVGYNVLAYDLIETVTIDKIGINEEINLNSFSSYKNADLTTYKCSNLNFDVSVSDGVMSLKRISENNSIAIKTGYYYMDGIEYYLYANDKFDEIEKIDNLYFYNVEKANKQFIFRQPTINHISNSRLLKHSKSNIHCLNCLDKSINNINIIDSITACDSYNYWTAPTSILSIVDSYNDVGIKIDPIMPGRNFSYLYLSEFTERGIDYIVSFYLKDKGNVYIGKERLLYSGDFLFNKQSVIEPIEEISESKIVDNIYYGSFTQDEGKYYLIVEGANTIDDIIIAKKDEYDPKFHIKNINKLNLDIEENIYSSYSTRFIIADEKGSKLSGTEVKGEKIINSSYIHWGYTNIKSFSTKEDFMKCNIKNADIVSSNTKAAIVTEGGAGTVTTRPIFLGNTKTINNMVIKINDVLFEEMKGFKTKVLTAQNEYSEFKEIQTSNDNIIAINGKILMPYIKLVVEMKDEKVINNIDIFVEYLSDNDNVTIDRTVLSGEYYSKIYDAQYTSNFRMTHLEIDDFTRNLDSYIFYVRGTKENSDLAVWTDWKEIKIKKNYKDYNNISNLVIFEDYRFFQLKAVLKGEDASINIKYLDIEVI